MENKLTIMVMYLVFFQMPNCKNYTVRLLFHVCKIKLNILVIILLLNIENLPKNTKNKN